MKITNKQIGALSSKLVRDIRTRITEKNNIVILSDEYRNFSQIDEESLLIKEICSHHKISCENILSSIRSDYFKLQIEPYAHELNRKIEDDLIIRSIECENLDELMSEMIDKYGK